MVTAGLLALAPMTGCSMHAEGSVHATASSWTPHRAHVVFEVTTDDTHGFSEVVWSSVVRDANGNSTPVAFPSQDTIQMKAKSPFVKEADIDFKQDENMVLGVVAIPGSTNGTEATCKITVDGKVLDEQKVKLGTDATTGNSYRSVNCVVSLLNGEKTGEEED